jgi:two-component system LytT family response regulator
MYQEFEFNKIPISCARTIEFVLPEKIVRFEALQNYTKVFLVSGKVIVSNNAIGFFKAYMESYSFVAIHKSHIVNPYFILRYHKDGTIELENNIRLPLARRRKKYFMEIVINQPHLFSSSFTI